MANVLSEKGHLTVRIGEGLISPYELGTLSVGDVVRSDQVVGRRLCLQFNGIPVASCDFVPIGGLFFAWITSVEPPPSTAAGPVAIEEMTELLSFTICGGSARLSLEQLRGLGSSSLISFGVPVSTTEDVELRVMGIATAWGKLVVIGQVFGIRITRLQGEASPESNVRASGYLVSDLETLNRVKDYDLSRPDWFTPTTISRIAEIHRYFLRYAGIRLPDVGGRLQMRSDQYGGVDQCTYGEWRAEIGAARFELLAAENAPWRPRWGGRKGEETARNKVSLSLVEPEDATVRVPDDLREQIVHNILERNAHLPWRNLLVVAYRSDGPLAALLAKPQVRETLLDCLKAGWKNVANLNLKWLLPDDPVFSTGQITPDMGMVITVTLADSEGRPQMYIVYPDVTLDPMMSLLD
jgi:flagellar motor switch/type III secretory pathway protein FliN